MCVCDVECEVMVLNPTQSNEVFQRTANVPSVLVWPSIAQREPADLSKWHLLQQEAKFSIVYRTNILTELPRLVPPHFSRPNGIKNVIKPNQQQPPN